MSKNVVLKVCGTMLSALASMGCLMIGPLVVPWNVEYASVAHGVFIAMACLFMALAIVSISKDQ